MNLKIIFLLIILNKVFVISDDSYVTIPNKIRFPYGPIQDPFIGIFLAISLPLELPEYNVFFSYNMEANYVLPSNQTEFSYPPLVSRSFKAKKAWDRKYFYDILEFKMKSHGYPGKECLLRTICEASLHTTANTGILGDILHILLIPSSSKDNILEDYASAERYAKVKGKCDKYEKKCSISFLDLISQILRLY